MDANSVSSGAKSGSSVLKSGSSVASAASRAGSSSSASLSSAASKASASAAKASAAAANALGSDKAPRGSFASPITLSILAIIVAGAYYGGYLDGLIAYIQNMLSQAQDQKEQILKDNTGHTSVRDAAKEQHNIVMEKGNNMTDQNSADVKRSARREIDNAGSMISSQTH